MYIVLPNNGASPPTHQYYYPAPVRGFFVSISYSLVTITI